MPVRLAKDTISLNGFDMTLDQAWSIAEGKAKVGITDAARKRVEKAFDTLMMFASAHKPVYGVTLGVGENTDQDIFDTDGTMTPEAREASKAFQINVLRSHGAGFGEPMPTEMVRLGMAIRLNCILHGNTGVQPRVAELYEAYLNNDIIPVVPSKGTVGEADILLSSHIGLAMLGEWDVFYNGERMNSAKAMKEAGIEPLDPIAKDALSIVSNNSLSVAYAMKSFKDVKQILKLAPTLFALSMEGLNGNVSPYLPQTNGVHPFPYVQASSATILNQLDGSYLWALSDMRPLQDPLSFRTSGYTFGMAEKAADELEAMLKIQINCSDDNPSVIVDPVPDFTQHPEVADHLFAGKGGVFPSNNFNPLPVTLAIQHLSLTMTQVSHNTVMRTIRLSNDEFTHLTRFLSAPTNPGHCFGAIQKAFVDLHSRNKQLAKPVSFEGISVADHIEDTFTNLKAASDNLIAIADNLSYLFGFELLHSTQAVDLRKIENPTLKLGKETTKLYEAYRQHVDFVDKDRPFTPDIQVSGDFVKHYPTPFRRRPQSVCR